MRAMLKFIALGALVLSALAAGAEDGGIRLQGQPTITSIGGVPSSRQVIAGTGLTGGGDLSANRTLTLDVAHANTWSGQQTFVAPILGTPASGVATNLTGTAAGLTAGTASAVAVGGITGLGTGVGAALALNVGSAGAPVLFNGALGTPSSGVGTNITGVNATTLGGATFAAPGAIGGGTPGTGAFTTIAATGLTISAATPIITLANSAATGSYVSYSSSGSVTWYAGANIATANGFDWYDITNGAARMNLTSAGLQVTTGTIRTKGYTVSTLPAAPGQGAIAYVTDAVACTFLAALTGGGTTYCPVTFDGSVWKGG